MKAEDSMKARALFFLNSFYGGGAERVCLNLAAQLYEFDIESDFVTVYDSVQDYEVPDYVHVFSLGIPHRHLACAGGIWSVPKVNRFVSGKKYVLITAHLQPAAFFASLTKVGKKCLYVMHVTQRLTDRRQSGLYAVVLRSFLKGKKTVTVSKGLEKELLAEYGIKKEHVRTIYNPCCLEALQSSPGTEKLRKRPYILVLGRLEEQKNPLLALDLYKKGKFYKAYDLIYLGKGFLEKSLRERIADYHLEDHVVLAGFRKHPKTWIKEASLLLSCSKYEGFGMNLIEALVCGTPVVASDCPYGPDEILIDELKPYLIDPEGHPEESIAVIASALQSYPEITEKYYQRFDAGLVTKTYLKVWRQYFA